MPGLISIIFKKYIFRYFAFIFLHFPIQNYVETDIVVLCTMQMNGNNIHGQDRKKTGSWVGIGEHLDAL